MSAMYVLVIARRIIGIAVLLSGQEMDTSDGSVYDTLGYIDNAFTIWGFIVLDPLSIYCNVRVTNYIKERHGKRAYVNTR